MVMGSHESPPSELRASNRHSFGMSITPQQDGFFKNAIATREKWHLSVRRSKRSWNEAAGADAL